MSEEAKIAAGIGVALSIGLFFGFVFGVAQATEKFKDDVLLSGLARSVINDCEATLPRDQNCVLTAEKAR